MRNSIGQIKHRSGTRLLWVMNRHRASWRYARQLLALVIAAVLVSSGLTNTTQAAEGDLDPTFDLDGKVITDFGSTADEARAVAIQKDGKIVAAGRANINGGTQFALARYNVGGSLDASFDGDGMLITDFGEGFDSQANAVAIQSNGRIVAAGRSRTDGYFALARYHSNGSLDESFGSGGKVITPFPNYYSAEAYALAIQQDGKIVAAGSASAGNSYPYSDFALARYNSNGTQDASFNNSCEVGERACQGLVTTNFQFHEEAYSVAIQPDNRIVAAGIFSNGGGSSAFMLARYNGDGSPDNGKTDLYDSMSDDSSPGDRFGLENLGLTYTWFGSYAYARAVAIHGGKIVAAGHGGNADFALARYNGDGTLDGGFNPCDAEETFCEGTLTTDFFNSIDHAYGVAIQPDGRIVAAGSTSYTNTPYIKTKFALARYDGSGNLDGSFGSGGKVSTQFADDDEAYAVAIQQDGKIVAAGKSGSGDFALARYASVNGGGGVIPDAQAIGDFNGDGRDDVIRFDQDTAKVRLSTGSGFANSMNWGTGHTSDDKVGDFNGDGKDDIVQFYNGRSAVRLSIGNSFAPWIDWGSGHLNNDKVGDFNGDGRDDIIQFYSSRSFVSLSTGSSFTGWTEWGTGHTNNDKVGDFNGDGRDDVIQFWYGRSLVSLSTGSSFGLWVDWGTGHTNNDMVGDFNGDGRDDVIQFYNGRSIVCLSTSSSFTGWTDWGAGHTNNDKVGDFNGDGRDDIVQYYPLVRLSTGSAFNEWMDWGIGS